MSGTAVHEVARLAAPPAPEAVFGRLAHLPHALWLDSTADVEGTGRWSFIAVDPFAVFRARDGRATWITAEDVTPLPGSPLDALDAALAEFRSTAPPPIPFDGGAAGFLGYETAAGIERLPPPPLADQDLPDMHLAFYDVVAGWDHHLGECVVVSTGRPARGLAREARAKERLTAALDWLSGRVTPPPGVPAVAGAPHGAAGSPSPATAEIPSRAVEGFPWLESTTSRSEYVEAVERIIAGIHDGDVYQVNLSQRFATRSAAAPLPLHRELRRRSPAPYGALLRLGRASLLSSSPERFLRVEPDRDGGFTVEARPIKGTRPRAADPSEDARLAAELRESVKDRAENLMIVDLLRNDLSRVCLPGSIEVPGLFRLESWATVHHLVSVVRGRLRRGVRPAELLRATFPCGSVTGAPKVRAMEWIAANERVARGPYCGAIGYFAFGGGIDLSVAIRILVADGGRVTFHAGGGVVADSDPEEEYRETLVKARAIVAAIEAVRGPGDGAGRTVSAGA